MKKEYTKPTLLIEELNKEDIIRTSEAFNLTGDKADESKHWEF